MINKNKILNKLTYSNVNKTFGAILFVLVFIFTFLLTTNDTALNSAKTIILIVFGSVMGLFALCWGGLILIVWHHKKSTDVNKQKIDKALDKLKEDAVEESKK
ncbi:MAG: hypothetical protein ACOQNV_02900 [Mycoplasmoidaceae bacterium]